MCWMLQRLSPMCSCCCLVVQQHRVVLRRATSDWWEEEEVRRRQVRPLQGSTRWLQGLRKRGRRTPTITHPLTRNFHRPTTEASSHFLFNDLNNRRSFVIL